MVGGGVIWLVDIPEGEHLCLAAKAQLWAGSQPLSHKARQEGSLMGRCSTRRGARPTTPPACFSNSVPRNLTQPTILVDSTQSSLINQSGESPQS